MRLSDLTPKNKLKESSASEWNVLHGFEAANQGYISSVARSNATVVANPDGEDYFVIREDTIHGKAGGRGKIRDPAKTKWHLDVYYYQSKQDKSPVTVVSKTVAKAEDQQARERKQKAAKTTVNKIKKDYGVDASSAFKTLL